MSFSKVLMVGLGGAGQRHLRILRQLLPDATVFSTYRHSGRTPLLRPDFTVEHGQNIEAVYGLKVFPSLESALADKPDLTVVCTPTALHREPMMMALDAGSAVLVEKPWAESLDGFGRFRDGMLAKNLPFHVSFQRRFHPLVQHARAAVHSGAIGRPMAASFDTFSHVPSWHPYEDWRTLYAVRPDLGGGVLLTEIHEIDLANWFFGAPTAVFCGGGNRGTDSLPVEDTVQLTLLSPAFSTQISLSFVHRTVSRRLHVAGTHGDIVWDAPPNRLVVTTAIGEAETLTDAEYTNDAMFVAQARRFLFDWTPQDSRDSFAAAAASLAVVDSAKRSMKSGCAEPVQMV